MKRSLLNAQGPLVHLLAGLIAPAWCYAYGTQPVTIGALLFCLLFALLPDLDSHASLIGRAMPFVSQPIERRFGHRQATHSLLALGLAAICARLLFGADWWLLSLAYLSHLLVDMLVGWTGIPLLWPHQSRFFLSAIRPASLGESLAGLLIGAFVLLPLLPAPRRAAQALIPQQDLTFVTAVPTTTPAFVEIRISHVADPDREIFVKPGDVITKGQLIADLAAWRAGLPPTATPWLTPTPVPTATPAATPSPAPPATRDPAAVAEAEIRLRLAQADATAAARAARPAPEALAAAAGQLRLTERDLQQRQAAFDAESWRPEIAMLPVALALEEATERHRLAAAAATASARTDENAIAEAQARLALAELAYQRAIATPTSRPTATPQPTPTPIATAAPPPPTLQVADQTRIYAVVGGLVSSVLVLSVAGNEAIVGVTIMLPTPVTSPAPASTPPSHKPAATVAPPSGSRPALIRHIVDGDTLDVRFGDGAEARLRILDVNAPETVKPDAPVECYGPEASAFVQTALCGGRKDNCGVQVTVWIAGSDKYGRSLAYLWTGDGVLFNEQIVALGYAYHETYGQNHLFTTRIAGAEQAARAAGRGLWSACP